MVFNYSVWVFYVISWSHQRNRDRLSWQRPTGDAMVWKRWTLLTYGHFWTMIDFWKVHDLPSLELTARENWSLGDYFDFGARPIFRGELVRWIEYGRIYSTNTKHEDLESREGKVKVHTLHTPAWYELNRFSRYCSVSEEVTYQTQPQAANPQFSKLPVHHESSSPKQRVAWNLVSSIDETAGLALKIDGWKMVHFLSGQLGGLFSRQGEAYTCWLTWWIEQLLSKHIADIKWSVNKLFAAWVSQCAAWNQSYSSLVHIHVSEWWYETPSFANFLHGFVLGLSIVW